MDSQKTPKPNPQNSPKKISVITKTGDRGVTSLYSLERVAKSHERIEAVGAIDELNAHLAGLGLEEIQGQLFELGARVANTNSKPEDPVLAAELQTLEEKTHEIEALLPPLQNFILPGGHPRAIGLHIARTVCRRAERQLVKIEGLPCNLVPYLNRLSDFLFVCARQINWEAGYKDSLWKTE